MTGDNVLHNMIENLYNERTIAKAKTIPDEIEFSDEDGNILEEFGLLTLTWEQKLMVAELSIKWHQSLEKTLLRMIMSGVRQAIKEHHSEEK